MHNHSFYRTIAQAQTGPTTYMEQRGVHCSGFFFNVLKSMELCSVLSELSVISQVSAVEGYPAGFHCMTFPTLVSL